MTNATARPPQPEPYRTGLWLTLFAVLCGCLPGLFAANISAPDLMAIELPNSGDTNIADSAAPMSTLLASVTSSFGPVTHDRVGYIFPIGPTLVTFSDGAETLPAYVYVYPYGETPIGVTGTTHGTAANKSANAVRDVNGVIHVAWYDQRPTDGVNWVMYRRGTQDPNTGEIAWAIPPTRISDAANESPDRNFVAVAASDTAVYFAWYRGSSPSSNNAVLRLDTATMTFGPIVNTGCPGRFSSTGCDLQVRSGGGINGQDQVCILTPGLPKFAISKQNGAAGSWSVEDVASIPAGRTWKMGAMDLDQWGNVHIAYACVVRGAASGTYSEASGNSAYWELRYARRNLTTGSWEDDHYLLQQFAPEWQDPQAVGNARADTDDLLSDWPDILVDDSNHIHACWHGSQNTGIYGNDEAFYIRKPCTGVNSWAAQWDSYHSLKPIVPPKGYSWAPSLCGEGNSHLALPVVFYNWDPNTAATGADNMIFDSRYQAFRDGAPEGSPVQLGTYAQYDVAGWFPSVNPRIYRHANGRAWIDVMRCDLMPAANNSNNVIIFQRAEVTDLLYPLITTQPVDQTVVVGNAATFTVAANGVGLTYQWQKDGVDIGGATSASYTTPATALGDNGQTYTVNVSNAAGAVTSNPASLYVMAAPNIAPTILSSITATPNPVVNASLSALSVVGFDADAGPAPLTYTWSQTAGPVNGVNFTPNGSTGADNTTATFLYDGAYTLQVSVSDGAASVTDSISIDVTLTAAGSTTVFLQDGLSGYAGTQDTYLDAFSPATSFGNSNNLEVRWYTGGTVENNIGLLKFDTTAIPSTATITSAQLDLWVTRTNSLSAADLLVMKKNTGGWSEATTYNDGVPAAVASGVTPPTLGSLPGSAGLIDPPLQYTIPGMGPLVQGWVSTPGSNQGVQFSCASDINLRFASREFGTAANRPMLTVTYSGGSLTGPTLVGQPQNVSVTAGDSALFGVVASGSAPITYQWRKNSAPIGGATAATYTTPATTLGDDGATYSVVVTNGQGSVTSNTVILSVSAAPNVAPVIDTAAAAAPNPVVSATTATVSVAASDPDSGPSALTYTWSKVSGPGTVSFSPNGTTGANSSTATFDTAGAYTLQVDVSDGSDSVSSLIVGLSVTLPNAAPTVATAAAAAPSPVTGTTTALSVLGADDGGEAGLSYTWSATGPAAVTYSVNGSNAAKASTATFSQAGSYVMTATISDGSLSTTSVVNVTVNQTLTTITVTPVSPTVQVSTTQSFSAAGVDQFGDAMAIVPAVGWTVSGGGSIDGSSGLFTAGSTPGGPFTVTATSGISGTASVTVTAAPNAAPTVATAAAAAPSPVTGTTTALSVLGADDGGEAGLSYTWSATGPAAVTYSVNGSNAAKASTATFSQAGSYVMTATISDGSLSTTSVVNVTVNQTLTTITVTPGALTMAAGGVQTFTASAKDQFGAAMAVAPAILWSLSDGGTIGSASGIYTAENYPGGPYTVTAQSGATSGVASVTLTGGSNPISVGVGAISLAGVVGSTTPVSQTITLTNNSSSPVNIGAASDQSWFTASPPGPVAIPAHGTLTVTVTADPTGLNGVFNATLTITPSAGSPQTIPVTFTVSTAAASGGKRGRGCALTTASDGGSWLWLLIGTAALLGSVWARGRQGCIAG